MNTFGINYYSKAEKNKTKIYFSKSLIKTYSGVVINLFLSAAKKVEQNKAKIHFS
jgi:hypothetical protein